MINRNTEFPTRSILVFLISIWILLLPAASSVAAQERGGAEPSATAQRGEPTGRELFIQSRCVRCHTIGRGRFVGPDLSGLSGRYSRDDVIRWITNPRTMYKKLGRMPVNEGYPPMPPLSVSPANAELIADYVLNFKPPPKNEVKKGGTIRGRMINMTSKKGVSGAKVELRAYMGDRATDVLTGTTNGEGEFDFDNLAWDRSYAVGVDFNGTQYESLKMVFFPGENAKTLELPVYEPTESSEHVLVPVNHMVLEFGDGVVTVVEIVLFNNKSDDMYVGSLSDDGKSRRTVEFDVPKGAFDINLLEGLSEDAVVKIPSGIASTSPIMPGTSRVVFSYDLRLDHDVKIKKTFKYSTEAFTLLASERGRNEGVDIEVEGLSADQPVEIQGRSYLKWSGVNFSPSKTVTIQIKTRFKLENNIKWIAVGILLIVIFAGVLYSFVRSGRTPPPPPGPIGEKSLRSDALKRERDELIGRIAELDAEREAGGIEDGEYESRRKEMKERAVELTRRLEKGGQ